MQNLKLPSIEDICASLLRSMNGSYDPGSRTEWTYYMKKVLCECFKGSECEAFYSESVETSEYLVDVCLRQKALDNRNEYPYRRMVLAAECEWSTRKSELIKDFVKLADVRADRKIFIGQLKAGEWNDRERIITELMLFLNLHDYVAADEQYGILLCSTGKNTAGKAWIIGKSTAREVTLASVMTSAQSACEG